MTGEPDGGELRSFFFPVEAGMIQVFAAAIGDVRTANEAAGLISERQPESVIAPPTFIQASAHFDPDFHLRPKPGVPWFGSASSPTGDEEYARERSASLHAEQHFELLKPLVAGQVLEARVREGASWRKPRRSGGSLHFVELIHEFTDDDGDLVARSRRVAVRVTEAEQ